MLPSNAQKHAEGCSLHGSCLRIGTLSIGNKASDASAQKIDRSFVNENMNHPRIQVPNALCIIK